MRLKALAAAAAISVAPLTAIGYSASATTLACTNTQSAVTAPYGCGGLEIAQPYAHGALSLSTNGVIADSAPIRVEPTDVSSSAQDFTVFAVGGQTTGGPGDLGRYVTMITENAQIPSFTVTAPGTGPGCSSATDNTMGSTYKNAVPCAGTKFAVGPGVYCISVAQYTGPNGRLRWWALERQCSSNGTFVYGTPTSAGSVSPSHANAWQVWAPVNGTSGLKLVNVSLRNKSNSDYDLNITANGGAGTQVQAYPDNSGGASNDQWTISGCTPPITLLSTSYWAC